MEALTSEIDEIFRRYSADNEHVLNIFPMFVLQNINDIFRLDQNILGRWVKPVAYQTHSNSKIKIEMAMFVVWCLIWILFLYLDLLLYH